MIAEKPSGADLSASASGTRHSGSAGLQGRTCLRKIFIGAQGRFSTDLDFTGVEEHDHEEVILDMMAAFEQTYHGIQFAIPDEGYYEMQDGLSWGVNPTYSHDWNQGGSEIKLQISRRIFAIRFPGFSSKRSIKSLAGYPLTICAVSSLDPSSTTMTSSFQPNCWA